MILTLEVVGEHAATLGAERRKVFHAMGGTIGRLPDNDWVFSDPYVSGRHALIRYVNGKFFIEDTSTNGVFVNSPDARIARDRPVELADGDRLYIDTYQIEVRIAEDPAARRRGDPFDARSLTPTPPEAEDSTASLGSRSSRPAAFATDDLEEDDVDEEDGATRWMPPPGSERAQPSRSGSVGRTDWMGSAVGQSAEPKRASADAESTHWMPPPAHQGPSVAADGTHWMPPPASKSGASSPNVSSEKSVDDATHWLPPPGRKVGNPSERAMDDVRRPVSSNANGGATERPASMPMRSLEQGALEELLASAGIEGLTPSRQTAQVLGQLLRIAVEGVMQTLRTREQLKQELNMRGTTFKAAQNNPLKFSANVEDAFHNLLVKHNSAYLEPVAALEDAFRAIRDHQATVHVAMRVAFEAVLAHFDPVRLQEEFDRQLKKGSILGVPAKLRYWDLYRDKYASLVKDTDAGFRTLFGEEFARAYEEQQARSKHID